MIINPALNQGKENIEKGDVVMERNFGKKFSFNKFQNKSEK